MLPAVSQKMPSQTSDQTKGSLLLPVRLENNDQGSAPGTTKSLNLQSLILMNSQYITLSDIGQHSTRMRCHFHNQQNCFFDYFNDPVPDGALIYAVDIPFQYSEKEGTYTQVFDNQPGNVFLAVH